MKNEMEINFKKKGDIIIIYLQGMLDFYYTASIGKEIHELISAEKMSNIIINLQEVEYTSSSGIGLFITTNTTLNNENRKLVLCNINREVSRIFDITNITSMFNIFNTEKEAVEFLKKE